MSLLPDLLWGSKSIEPQFIWLRNRRALRRARRDDPRVPLQ